MSRGNQKDDNYHRNTSGLARVWFPEATKITAAHAIRLVFLFHRSRFGSKTHGVDRPLVLRDGFTSVHKSILSFGTCTVFSSINVHGFGNTIRELKVRGTGTQTGITSRAMTFAYPLSRCEKYHTRRSKMKLVFMGNPDFKKNKFEHINQLSKILPWHGTILM